MLKKVFKELKFSEKETRVYLALVKLGHAKASKIFLETGVNRTTVYDILDVLVARGLVSKYKKGGAMYFNALSPEKLLDYLDHEKRAQEKRIDQQKKMVSGVLPELVSMQNIYPVDKPRVQFFEGEKGMREAYEDTLTTKGIILAYANVEEMHKGLPDFFPDYYKRRAKAGIHIKTIMPRNKASIERSKNDSKEMRTTKFLSSEAKMFTPEMNIYDNKVLIVSWREKMAVRIESKEFTDLQRVVFEQCWGSL